MTPENKFYVYIHRRGDTNEVFYVGKGHGKRAGKRQGRSEWWRRVVAKHGYSWEIVERDLFENDAYDLEVELIKFYRDCGHELVNLSDGGAGGAAGVPKSEEWKAMMSIKMKARVLSSEHIERMREGARRRAQAAGDRERRSVARKKGRMPDQRKPVRCSNGMCFASKLCAMEWLVSCGYARSKNLHQIRKCCMGNDKRAYGFDWEYITQQEYADYEASQELSCAKTPRESCEEVF